MVIWDLVNPGQIDHINLLITLSVVTLSSLHCLHYICEVAKFGTAATGNFLSGNERESNVAKLKRISGLPKKLKHETSYIYKSAVGGGAVEGAEGGGQWWGADTCKAWVAQINNSNLPSYGTTSSSIQSSKVLKTVWRASQIFPK